MEGEHSPRRHPTRRAQLRVDKRGCHGCVRQELAQRIGLEELKRMGLHSIRSPFLSDPCRGDLRGEPRQAPSKRWRGSLGLTFPLEGNLEPRCRGCILCLQRGPRPKTAEASGIGCKIAVADPALIPVRRTNQVHAIPNRYRRDHETVLAVG
jgi:hypothetical protein